MVSVVFSRTLRSLQADGYQGVVYALAVSGILVAAWLAWMFLARVSVYEVSDAARLEVLQSAHILEAPLSGEVVASHLKVAARVAAGDVLVELDASTQHFHLREQRARLDELIAQRDRINEERIATQKMQKEAQEASDVGLSEQQAHQASAEVVATLAGEELTHVQSLRAAGNATEIEVRRADADARQRAYTAQAAALAVKRIQREREMAVHQHKVRIEELAGQFHRLEGDIVATQNAIERLTHEVKQRKFCAPIDGTLGEVAALRPGSYLREGQRFGAIVPAGKVMLTADFPAATALGRIRLGQAARLRLTGFPWSQYGSVAATVVGVGSEVRDGRIQVEFDIDADTTTSVPLQHGLPGTVEVQIERVTPASLVLRWAGRRATPHPAGRESSPPTQHAGPTP